MAQNHYAVGRGVPSFHRPFTSRQPSDTIPLQPLPTLTTNFSGNFLRVNNQYTPHHQYGSSSTLVPAQTHTQLSPALSTKTPSTPGLRVTSTEETRERSAFNPSHSVNHVPNPWLLWLRGLMVKFFVEWWMLEILSWCFSALCMGAIIIIIIIYDGHGIPSWYLGITINGLISVFANLAKSALLLSTAEALGQLKWNWFRDDSRSMMDFERIDMASRGPWGAFLLLLRTKGTTLTSIGALIVVLALPLDLFFQQIVSYPLGWIPANGMAATIPRSIVYEPLDGIFTVNGSERLTFSREITVFSEPVFLGTGIVPELISTCPTSNCTWEPYDTLAVCSRCSDMSQDLFWDCATAPADWLSTVMLADDSFPDVTACGYWFKYQNEPSVLMSGYVVEADGTRGEALLNRFFPLTDPDPTSRKPIFGGTFNFQDVHNPIIDMLVSGVPDGAVGAYANKTPTLSECVLHWCVNTVESSFAWGHRYENITNSVQLETTTTEPPWFTFTDENGLTHNKYMADFNLSLPPGNRTDLHNNAFGVGNLTMLKTIFLMDEIAPAYLTAPDDLDTSIPSLRWLNGGQAFNETLPQGMPTPTSTNAWLPPSNVSAHMDLLAKVMTTVMRNTHDENGALQNVTGTAWTQITFVEIRWAWISLPLALLFISLIFLVATVIKSTQEEAHVGIWKTSVIAVLFNGLGDEVQQSVGHNCRMGEARNMARKLKVKLTPD